MKNLLGLALAVVASGVITPPARADLFDADVYCRVAKIRTGQLALRRDDRSKTAFAGLNNGDKVQATHGAFDSKTSTFWYVVRILKASNSSLDGQEGLVNSRFLTCDWHGWSGNFQHDEAKG